jgi:hypothetical protein
MPEIGQNLSHYSIAEKIAKGGMEDWRKNNPHRIGLRLGHL